MEPSLTVNNAYKGQKQVQRAKKRQPLGLSSMTFHDPGLIPWLSRPWKF